VPAWRLLGNKLRDRVLLYCDTTGISDPKIYGERMRKRQQQGFKFFKMDLYTGMVADKKGAVDSRGVATDLGLKYLCEIIQGVRNGIGWQAPLAADHFGDLTSRTLSATPGRSSHTICLGGRPDFLLRLARLPGNHPLHYHPTLTGERVFGLEEGFKASSITMR